MYTPRYKRDPGHIQTGDAMEQATDDMTDIVKSRGLIGIWVLHDRDYPKEWMSYVHDDTDPAIILTMLRTLVTHIADELADGRLAIDIDILTAVYRGLEDANRKD